MFFECEFHPIQRPTLTCGQFLELSLVLESFHRVIFQIDQDPHQGAWNTIGKILFGFHHSFGQFIKFRLNGIIIAFFHMDTQFLNLRLKGFEGTFFA